MRADGNREDCNCDPNGSEALTCDAETGQCHCKCNVIGDKCDTCASGYHNFPATVTENCHECNCNDDGSSSFICDVTSGQCPCKNDQITGLLCDRSIPGFFNFPDPEECQCNADGSVDTACDDGSGKCTCNPNIVGDKCTQCAAEHFAFPTCDACMCHAEGSVDNSCDDNGKCSCNNNVVGDKCDQVCTYTFFLL